MPYDDQPDEEWVEDEASGDDWLMCPSCRAAVHEDTQQCPKCGDWITPIWPGEAPKRTVWLLAVGLIIAALLLMTVF